MGLEIGAHEAWHEGDVAARSGCRASVASQSREQFQKEQNLVKHLSIVSVTVAMFFCLSLSAQAQDAAQDDAMKNCPMHKQHGINDHHATVEKHGDQGMGFSHDATTHHFRIASNGGVIQVTANDPTDKTSTE